MIGWTESLVSGKAVWDLHATHGYPLEMSLADLADRRAVPEWDQLLLAAKADGTNIPRLLRRLDDAVADAYPPEIASVIRRRLPGLA